MAPFTSTKSQCVFVHQKQFNRTKQNKHKSRKVVEKVEVTVTVKAHKNN